MPAGFWRANSDKVRHGVWRSWRALSRLDFFDGFGQVIDHDGAPRVQRRRGARRFDARHDLARRRACGQQFGDGAKQAGMMGAEGFDQLEFEGEHTLYSAPDGEVQQDFWAYSKRKSA